MKIMHELVQTNPRLPFKYYEHDPATSITVDPHWHQGIEINYLIRGGVLKFVTDGKTTEYRPGHIWSVDHRIVHSASGDERDNWLEIGLIIDEQFLTKNIPISKSWKLNLDGSSSKSENPEAYSQLQTHLIAIHNLFGEPITDLSRLKIMSHFYEVVAIIGQSFVISLDEENNTNPNTSLIDSVVSTINQQFSEAIDGNYLADEFNVSLTTLNKQFNENMQMSVNRYLRMIRLMNARRMLLETDEKINYIASKCGFVNVKTFNRNFKSWKNLTPSEYRKYFSRYHQIDTKCF